MKIALRLLVGMTSCIAAAPATTRPPGLREPAMKDVAMQLVSAAENSSLDWKAQYAYLEYNVEHNAKENRGYTGGIIGFTSKTDDMLEMVAYYESISPNNPLSRFLPRLKKVDGTASRDKLGKPFERAWKTASTQPAFRAAQDHERDTIYFDPAVDQAQGRRPARARPVLLLRRDRHARPGDDATSFGGIRKTAMQHAKTPADGGDERTYLNAFLDARVAAMKTEEAHSDTSRVDTEQRFSLNAGNLTLRPPLVFQTYGDAYRIEK